MKKLYIILIITIFGINTIEAYDNKIIIDFINHKLSTIANDDTFINLSDDSLKMNYLETVTIVTEKSRSVPGSGQYINSKKLALLNQTNVNNVLRTIPGISIRDEEGFGLRPNIGLRGTTVNRSSKVTLMEDGILIAPAPYADPAAYYFPSFSRMQGIEVLKGSSQIKYGPYTVGGAINMISSEIPIQFKGFARVAYGSFGTNQLTLRVGESRKYFDYIFEVNRMASNGFKELDNGGKTGFDRRDILGKIRWHNAVDAVIPQSLTLKYVNSVEKGNESYLGLTYHDFVNNPVRRYSATQKDFLDMNHNHTSLQYLIHPVKGLTITSTAYSATTFRDWSRVNAIGGQSLNNIMSDPYTHHLPYQIMVGKADGNINYQSAARTYFSKGIQTNAQYIFNSNAIVHNIQYGIRYHVDQADRYATLSTYRMTNGAMVLSGAGIKGNKENQIRNASSLATYFTYDLVYKGLKLSPGIRYENIAFSLENYGTNNIERRPTELKTATNKLDVVLPGFGLSYDVNKQINIFSGIHKGFSPPGTPRISNSDVQAKEETSINYEIGIRLNQNGINTGLTGFFNNYQNILGSDNLSGGGAGTGDMFNAGNANIRGIEFSLDYNLFTNLLLLNNSKLPISIAYTYTDARFLKSFKNAGGDWGTGQINANDYIPFITPHVLSAGIGFEKDNFNINLTGRYIGKTRIKPEQSKMIFPNDLMSNNEINAIESFSIIDLSTNYKVNKIFTIFSSINNITNSKKIIANLPNGYRPNMPLSINLGVKLDF